MYPSGGFPSAHPRIPWATFFQEAGGAMVENIKRRLQGMSFDPRRAGRLMRGAVLEGWYVRGDEMSGNRKNQLFFGYTANIIANMIGGNFFTGLLLYMNADDAFIGVIAMITFACNILQILSPLLLERFPKRKRLLMGVRAGIMTLNIAVIGITPLLPLPQAARLSMIAAAVLLVNVLNAATSSGFTVWHIQFVPWNMRARFFSMISMTNGLVVAAVTLLSSRVVDLFKAHGMELTGLLALRCAALLLAGLDLYILSRMKEYPYSQEGRGATLRDIVVKPFREKKYLMTVLLACMWHFTANIPGSYYSVYLLREVGVSYSFITLVSMLNVPVLLFLTPVWRRLLTRISWFKMLGIAMGLYSLHLVGLSYVTPRSLFLYPVTLLWAYVLAVGINLSFTNIPYVNIPEKNQTIYIAFYSTMANAMALLGAAVGRQFIAATAGMSFRLPGLAMGNKQTLMLLVFALMLAGAVVVYLLEPRTRPPAGDKQL